MCQSAIFYDKYTYKVLICVFTMTFKILKSIFSTTCKDSTEYICMPKFRLTLSYKHNNGWQIAAVTLMSIRRGNASSVRRNSNILGFVCQNLFLLLPSIRDSSALCFRISHLSVFHLDAQTASTSFCTRLRVLCRTLKNTTVHDCRSINPISSCQEEQN